MNTNHASMLSDEEATLYDRQIRLWGADAQLKLRQTRLLMINVNSLSIEVCKNLCLAGVASITVFDNTAVSTNDLELDLTMTMNSESDIGQFKAVCTCRFLQQLNPRVQLIHETSMKIDQIDQTYLEQFDYVCLFNNYDFPAISHLNKLCRQRNSMDENGRDRTHFFCASTFGSYGVVFKDLGDIYEYLSENLVGSESLVKGDGVDETKKNEKITSKMTRHYSSFETAMTNEWKGNRRQATSRSAFTTYTIFRALLKFHEQNQRAPTRETQETDQQNFMNIIQEKLQSTNGGASSSNVYNADEFHDDLLSDLVSDNNAVASIVGGIMSHDIVKAISKQEAKDNFFFFNGVSCVGLSVAIGC